MPDSCFHPNSDSPVYRETPATEKEKGEASLFQAPGFIRGVLILNWNVCVRPTALPCILRQALPQASMVSEARQSDVTLFPCIADFWCRWAIDLWCNWMD